MRQLMTILCWTVLQLLIVSCHGNELTTVTGWQSGKSIAECNRYMFDNHLSTDVSFQVGPQDGAQSLVRAHKYVLMSRSAVFEKMLFRHQKQLEDQNQTSVALTTDAAIRISDMDPGVFKEMLNFIYTDNATVSAKTVLPMMYAGKMFQLPKLINECQRVLQTRISTDNVCVILDQAIFFNEPELINKTVEFISKNIDAVLKSESFLALTQEALRYVISNDNIRINETTLYLACLKWADAQRPGGLARVGNATDPVLRETLGDVLYKIRFPSMTLKEFAAIAGKSEVLSCSEKSSVYYYIVTGDDGNKTLKFDRKLRYGEKMIDRFGIIQETQWGCNHQPDAIMFTISTAISLTAIGTFLQHVSYANAPIAIDINEHRETYDAYRRRTSGAPVRVGGTASFTITYPSPLLSNGAIVRIPLDQPISIKAGTMYSVNQRFANGQPTCYRAYGNSGRGTVYTETAVSFTFSAANTYGIGTSTTVAQGQIPRLYYTA